jgi:hypothetical protein
VEEYRSGVREDARRELSTWGPAWIEWGRRGYFDMHGWHELEVKLRGKRGDVLARPAYFRPPRNTP